MSELNGGVGSVRVSLSADKFGLNFLSRIAEVSGASQNASYRKKFV